MVKSSKELVYDYIKLESSNGNNKLDTTIVAKACGIQRTNASSLLNELVREGLISKTNTRPVYFYLQKDSSADIFEKLIGSSESLSNVIQLAKAAVHYPGRSLNTLIIGDVGTGKSYLSNLIFEYGVNTKVLSAGAKLHKLNCRHYIHNEEILRDKLFRQSDNTFTNIFEEAKDSYLLIDNIHLLDGVSLGKLITFIETQKLEYLDGTVSDTVNTTLILTTDLSKNVDLINSLKLKIPVILNLPKLTERGLSEKVELINSIFANEAIVTKHHIEIDHDVLSALLISENDLNIKYLIGTVKLAVANAYLRTYDQNLDTIKVLIHDFEKEVSDLLLKYRDHKQNIEKFIPKNFNYFYSKDGTSFNQAKYFKEFYENMNSVISFFHNNEMNKEKTDQYITSEIEKFKETISYYLPNNEVNVEQLSKIVDKRIINIVTEFVKKSSIIMDVSYPNTVIYGLCLHINAIYKNGHGSKYLSDEKVIEIKDKYPSQFKLAKGLSKDLVSILNRDLSDEEVSLISLFLNDYLEVDNDTHPQLLVAMHGAKSATSIANVINDLVNFNNTYAYDLALDKSSIDAYTELKKLISKIDQGQGVIVIYDMGSLKIMLEKIASELDVDIRLIYMPITLIGIEASRQIATEKDIDVIHHSLLSGLNKEMNYVKSTQMAIITLCHTGEGGAVEIKEYLKRHLLDDIKIYSFAISDRKKLLEEVKNIRKFYDIRAFVGTYNPKLYGIPFVPVSRIFEVETNSLDKILFSNMRQNEVDYKQMIEYLNEESNLDKEKLSKTLPKVLDKFDEMYGLTIDQKVGLFLHIGALVNRLLRKEQVIENENTELYFEVKLEDMQKIKEVIKRVEHSFNVIIPDSEIATIYEILREESIYE